jgi:hypothetical protein
MTGRYFPPRMPAPVKRGVFRWLGPVPLVPAGAFAVHQLRFWLAFHGRAGVELERQGHAYLHSLIPWVVLLIAVAVGIFLRALGRAFSGRRSLTGYTMSFGALWLISASCLLVIYICQESLEGWLASGHPGGLVGVFGYGGWWSIPAALGVGLVLAATFHGAQRVLEEVADRCARLEVCPAGRPVAAGPPRFVLIPRLAPLADGWSGRGPPR